MASLAASSTPLAAPAAVPSTTDLDDKNATVRVPAPAPATSSAPASGLSAAGGPSSSAAAAAGGAAAVDKKLFGMHIDITCDGCAVKPIVGFRYKCTECANHDLCEPCHEVFKSGKLNHINKLNNISKAVDKHAFKPYADKSGSQFQAMHSATDTKPAAAAKAKKQQPNDACACGSGKKHKKCCMNKK